MASDPPRGDFAGFRSAVDHPQQRPDPVVLGELDRRVADFRAAAVALDLGTGFADAMVAHLKAAFRRLDAVPRDDLFWDGTNRRPTHYKLSPFCMSLASSRPGDVEVAWLAVATSTVVGLYFPASRWAQLAAAGDVDPRWIVAAALHAEHQGSYDTVGELAGLLSREGLFVAVTDSLRSQPSTGSSMIDEWISAWKGRVFDACDRAR